MQPLFNEELSKIADYSEISKKWPENIEEILSMFSDEPFSYFKKNYSQIIEAIEKDDGFKVRVSVKNTKQMLELSKTLPFFCDNVIFSPAPLWNSCHYELEHPWPEFCTQSAGFQGINVWDVSFIPGLAALKPLIEKESIKFLPHYGESLHQWKYSKLSLPSLPNFDLESKEPTAANIVEKALNQLYIDNIVSSNLGCMHLLPYSSKDKIGINGVPSLGGTSDTNAAYALMKLKIPYITNLSYDEIAQLKEDEYEHFQSFREGIRLALSEISEDIDSTSNLDSQVEKIQRNYIDEPLKDLESRLTRLAKYQSYRMAGYAVASTSMLLASSLTNDFLKSTSQAIGTISILKIFESFIDYLEKVSEIEDESIFYLLKAKKLGEKSINK